MNISTRHTLLSLALGVGALGCGGSHAAAVAKAPHAVPDFEHADRTRTPTSVAETRHLTVSTSRALLPPEDVVFFNFDSARLTPSACDYLDTVATWLREHPSRGLVVEGHTDPTGTAAYNQDLGARRAEVVRQYLVSHGVAEARISIQSLGESRAVYSQNDMDRRSVVYVHD
jgi:outer membrane protein OmpA-like peptidoglycan-associated protein